MQTQQFIQPLALLLTANAVALGRFQPIVSLAPLHFLTRRRRDVFTIDYVEAVALLSCWERASLLFLDLELRRRPCADPSRCSLIYLLD
ncbi:hypothetical protein C8R43DRAFT_979407 [Mycena crocata]|nr:hypothetical protein C8R43DRAFT_979407 [Mycena crocata]